MGIEHMLYVPYLKVNLLSVVSFEDEGYAVVFQDGQVLVYSKEATQDIEVVLGVRKERLYRLLGRPIIGSNGFLDSTSYSMSDSTDQLHRYCQRQEVVRLLLVLREE
jgi:hypothetical protein